MSVQRPSAQLVRPAARRGRSVLLTLLFACALLPARGVSAATTVDYTSPGFPYSFNNSLLLSGAGWNGTLQVVTGASAETNAKAATLQTQLQRITGALIPRTEGNGTAGIKFGTYDEWRPVLPALPWLSGPYDYVVITVGQSVRIMGKDQASLERALWRFLELLGYRQYFPGPTWEVVPAYTAIILHIGLGENQAMKFVNGMATGCGVMPYATAPLDDWKVKNRVAYEYGMPFGHSWQSIVLDNQAEFDAHPEYSSSVGRKLCVLEPRVQEMAVAWAKSWLSTRPDSLTVSLSATDGSTGWDEACENSQEQAQYSPSDRQVLLANHVQQQLAADPLYAAVRVAIMAYGDTSPGPSVPVDPRLVVVVTKGYMRDGLTYADVAAAYQARGAVDIGPYSYLSVWTWNRNAPGASLVASTDRIVQEIEDLNITASSPLRFYTGEGSDSWGPDGLGYYLLGKLLIEPTRSRDELQGRVRELKADFFTRAFGTASSRMEEFYALISGDPYVPLLTTDLLHRMYAKLAEALLATTDPLVGKRIQELALYTRYAELYRVFKVMPATAAGKVDAFDAMLAHLYRMRETQLVHYRCAFYDPLYASYLDALETRYGLATLTPYVPTDGNPWSGAPFTDTEIGAFITQGIANNPTLPFTPIGFSADLVKPTAFDGDPRARKAFVYLIKDHHWYLFMKADQSLFEFSSKSGIAYQTLGDSSLAFVDLTDESTVATFTIPADKTLRSYQLALAPNRLYRIDVTDKGGLDIDWDTGFAMTQVNEEGNIPPFMADYGAYFYVPRGTTTIGGYWKSADSRLIDPDGNIVLTNSVANTYFAHSVPSGADGKVWQIDRCNKDCYLMTVPPQIAFHPRELLLPREVVNADGLQQAP